MLMVSHKEVESTFSYLKYLIRKNPTFKHQIILFRKKKKSSFILFQSFWLEPSRFYFLVIFDSFLQFRYSLQMNILIPGYVSLTPVSRV